MSVTWDGRTHLTSLTDPQLREIADDAGRHQRRLLVRRRWWWRDLSYGAEVELAYRALAARPEGSRPTDEQQRVLGVLRVGPWTRRYPFAAEAGLDLVTYAAALRDAQKRGWIQGEVGPFGGHDVRPGPGKTELTTEGSQTTRRPVTSPAQAFGDDAKSHGRGCASEPLSICNWSSAVTAAALQAGEGEAASGRIISA
jgi:hypothetical protein